MNRFLSVTKVFSCCFYELVFFTVSCLVISVGKLSCYLLFVEFLLETALKTEEIFSVWNWNPIKMDCELSMIHSCIALLCVDFSH